MGALYWQQVGLVMAGGALGSLARFCIGDAMTRRLGQGFPWGTLCANLLGAFLAGYLLVWLQTRGGNSPLLRAFLIVGLMGGLTTFSSMMLESLVFARSDRGLMVPAYIAASVVGGLVLVWLGARLAEALR